VKNQLLTDDPKKREVNKRRAFTLRINVFFFATFFLFSILIVRLAMLQFVQGEELKAQEALVSKKDTPIPPIRGNIYDRSGVPIAYTSSAQSLYFRIESGQKKDEVIALAYELERIFREYGRTDAEHPPLTAADIIKGMDVGYDINKNDVPIINYSYVPRRIKSDLTKDEIAYLMERRDQLKWLEIMEESIRNYNDEENRMAVQLVGYMRSYSVARSNDNLGYKNKEGYIDTEYVGFDGIELMYQDVLRGKNGYKTYPVNAAQKIVGNVTITPPEKGHNLYLTIDKEVQKAAEQAIVDQLAYMKSPAARAKRYGYAPNARAGYAVAMEVKTGKVVAMASMPDYDPNLWNAGSMPETTYRTKVAPYVNNGTITTAYPDYPEDQLKYHPSSIVYVGSTIKPLSVLIGLKEGFFNPRTTYYDSGVFYYGRDNSARLRNSDGKAFGNINATQALRFSSNTFMSAMIGIPFHAKYGAKAPDVWAEYLAQFGLGVSTESGLPREYAGLNEFQTNTKESVQSRMVFASWGQNEKYTTLQLAQYATTLANRGKRLKPLLVDRIETYEGELVQKFDGPVVLNEAEFSPQHWDAVISGMESSVQGFGDFPYSLARKTGTSTQWVAKSEVDNAVFIAFAPKENPTLAVAVVVPEGGFGAWGAAPIARKIFDAYDQQYGLDGVPKGKAAEGGQQQ